jgi:hypothetical protein
MQRAWSPARAPTWRERSEERLRWARPPVEHFLDGQRVPGPLGEARAPFVHRGPLHATIVAEVPIH